MKKYSKFAVRAFSFLLAAVLLLNPLVLGLEVNAADAVPPIKKGTVDVAYLNVRSGAGTNHKTVGGLWRGAVVDILDEQNGWYKIDSGWISAAFVKLEGATTPSPSPSATPTPTPTPTPLPSTPIGKGTVDTAYLYVRSGAGTNYKSVGGLWKGAVIDIYDQKDNWYRTKDGWVCAEFVKLEGEITVTPTPTPSATPTPTPAPSVTPTPTPTPTPDPLPSTPIGKGTVSASYLFVRSGAGSNYKSLGGLWRGTVVDIYAKQNGWYRIKTGWVSAEFVKLEGETATTPTPAPSTPSTTPSTGNATVTASLLFIRKDPTTNYPAIGSLRRGARIQVTETNGNWAKIPQGWVYSQYVAMDSGASIYSEKKLAVVTANELNIRETPSTAAKSLGTLRKNQKVEVLQTSGEWIRTNFGWVNKNFVKLVDSTSANNIGTVKAMALNIRKGPGTGYAVAGTLRLGQKVTILENQGAWMRIAEGWISSGYIKIGG